MPLLVEKICRSEGFVAAVVLLAVLNLLFFPVIWGNKTLICGGSDVSSIMPYGAWQKPKPKPHLPRSIDMGEPGWAAEPTYSILHTCIMQKRIVPLWNPYNGFGVPLLANMQSQPFNPLIALAWLHPSPRGADLFALARLLVAGMMMHFYLRLFLSRYAAIFGAIAFMLTGYFMIYINARELSVSIWLPGLMLSIEYLAQSLSFRAVVATALMTAAVLLGGMPEVSFLALVLGAFYCVCRVFSKQQKSKIFALYWLSSLLGVAIAAPQVVPFLEYAVQSSNVHAPNLAGNVPGLVHQSNFFLDFANYLIPMVYGPLGAIGLRPEAGFQVSHGYWGVTVVFFAIMAISCALSQLWTRTKINERDGTLSQLCWFYAAVVFVLVGKRFGLPLVNWLGSLPLAQMVLFWKYSEPLIGFSMATLAAIGFDFVVRRTVNWQRVSIVFAVALLTVIAIKLNGSWLLADHFVRASFDKLTLYGAVTALVAFVLSVGAVRTVRARSLCLCALVILLAFELCQDFVVPTYYRLHTLADREANPYLGAPYTKFLSTHNEKFDRVLGLDSLLFPNWSSAFQLYDPRALDALYPERYLSFVRNFIYPPDQKLQFEDQNLTTRFHGAELMADPLYSTAPLSQLKRFWTLSSVRYLLATQGHFLLPPTNVTREILAQNHGANPDYLKLSAFMLDRKSKYVLFQHPYGPDRPNLITYKIIVPRDRPWLHFCLGMDQTVFGAEHGDGVSFHVNVSNNQGSEILFVQYIDPKRNQSERQWNSQNIDLHAYQGQAVTISFAVDAGPKGNCEEDRAGWADLQFEKDPSQSVSDASLDAPQVVYDDEIQIYELPHSLARASLFSSLTVANSPKHALQILRSESLNVLSTVVLEADELTESMKALSKTDSAEPATSQTIISYEPLRVAVAVQAKRPGLLMLNDTDYPGWRVYVDGKQEKMVHADYLFRGVAVGAGAHEVVFVYEPDSFKLGIAFFLIAIVSIGAYGLFGRFMRRRP